MELGGDPLSHQCCLRSAAQEHDGEHTEKVGFVDIGGLEHRHSKTVVFPMEQQLDVEGDYGQERAQPTSFKSV